MSDIEEIVESIQKQLQRNGISAAMAEIGEAMNSVSKLQDLIVSLESSGDYDGMSPVRNAVRSAQGELASIQRMVGQPESVLNEAIFRIRNT